MTLRERLEALFTGQCERIASLESDLQDQKDFYSFLSDDHETLRQLHRELEDEATALRAELAVIDEFLRNREL